MRRGRHGRWVAGMVLVWAVGLVSVGHAQTIGGGAGAGVGIQGGFIPGTAFGGATDPSMVQITEGYRIIPTITAAERYDSNVFFIPKTPGVDTADYVTTLAPQIRGLVAGSGMTLNTFVSANAEYYVKNTGFNYIGANAGLNLGLGSILDPLWKGMKITMTDTFSYTPQPPAFFVGDQPSNTSSTTNVLANGTQVGRVNTLMNNYGGALVAPLTQTLSLTGGYSRGFIRFGTSDVQQAGTLLNTSYQTFTVGLSTKLSLQDTVALTYLDSSFKYDVGGSFTTRGGTLGWTHIFNPSTTLVSTLGAQVFEGGVAGSSSVSGSTSPAGGSGSSSGSRNIAPTGGLALTWKDRTTSVTMGYGLFLSPSYQFGAAPLLVNTISVSVVQVTPIPGLAGLLSGNYYRGDEFGSTSQTPIIAYQTYAATAGVLYKITPKSFLNLNYLYTNYDSQFGGQGTLITRNLVSLNFTHAFY